MAQVLVFNDDGSFEDVTDDIAQVLLDNQELTEVVEELQQEVQLSHETLSLARKGAANAGGKASAQIAAPSRAAGKVTPRGSAAIASAAKAAGGATPTPVAVGAKFTTTQAGGAAAKGARKGRAAKAGAATFGKHVMHAGKVASRFAKKHPIGAAVAAGAAGGAAASSLRERLGLSQGTLELEEQVIEAPDEEELIPFDEVDFEDQVAYLDNCDEGEAIELYESLPDDQQAELTEHYQREQLSDFATSVMAQDAERRRPKVK